MTMLFRVNREPRKIMALKKPPRFKPTDLPPPDEKTEKQRKEIVIKGPIGYAYTDVLNHLLGKEENREGEIEIRGADRMEALHSQLSNTYNEETEQTVLFVEDGRNVGLVEVDAIQAEIEIDLSKRRDKVPYIGVVIEHIDKVANSNPYKHAAIIEALEYLRENFDVQIFHSREAAIRSIQNALGLK